MNIKHILDLYINILIMDIIFFRKIYLIKNLIYEKIKNKNIKKDFLT